MFLYKLALKPLSGETLCFTKSNAKRFTLASIFTIVVLKGSELPVGAKGRRYKGRIVYMGNNIRDLSGDIALFQETASSPASLESGKVVIAHGLQDGYIIEQADAVQAYVQAKLDPEATGLDFSECHKYSRGKRSCQSPRMRFGGSWGLPRRPSFA